MSTIFSKAVYYCSLFTQMLLVDKRCLFCREALSIFQEKVICQACCDDLPTLPMRPSEPWHSGNTSETVILYSVFQYIYPIDTAIIRFKFYRDRSLERFFATQCLEAMREWMRITECSPDWVIPVPLHKKRRRERGYNQAELLVQYFHRLGLAVNTKLILRKKATKAQSELSTSKRWRNIRGAFQATKDAQSVLKNKTILIVDDVVTTGATVTELAKCLQELGVSRIMVLSLARA